MEVNEEFKENSQAVQAHLNITQSVIQRMAGNSAACKVRKPRRSPGIWVKVRLRS